jgi:hypothetical protein
MTITTLSAPPVGGTMDDVTLVTIETMYHGLAKRAMEETLSRVPFKHAMVFSDQDFLPGAKHVKIEHGNMESYCNLMLKGMLEHVETPYIIFQQWDAMVHDGSKWRDYFLLNDYIGATWPWRPHGQNVGNGGFSLRSRRLLEELQAPHIQLDPSDPEHGIQEDNYIAIKHRAYLESKGMIFAFPTVANQFSIELSPDADKAMAHHGLWNVVQFMPRDVVEYFITNCPDNTWNEVHRAHHTIVCLAGNGYLDLLGTQAERIKASPVCKELCEWMSNEEFPNKAETLKMLQN